MLGQFGSRYLDAYDTRLGSSKEGTAVDFVDSTAAEFIGRLFTERDGKRWAALGERRSGLDVVHVRPARKGFALRCVNRDRAIAPVKRQKPPQARLSGIGVNIQDELARDNRCPQADSNCRPCLRRAF